MRLTLILITIVVLAASYSSIQISSVSKRHKGRTPASVYKPDRCREYIAPFFYAADAVRPKPFSYQVMRSLELSKESGPKKFMRRLSYKLRMTYLYFLSLWVGDSEYYNLKLAHALNESIMDGMITPQDARAVVARAQMKGNRQVFMNTSGYVGIRTLQNLGVQRAVKDSVDDLMTRNPHLGPSMVKKYRDFFATLEVFPEDIKYLVNHSSSIRLPTDDKGYETFTSYIIYAMSYRYKNKMLAFTDIGELFSEEASSKFIKRFRKYDRKFKRYQDKAYKKLVKKYSKKESAELASERASREAFSERRIYEKLTHGCRSTKMTKEHRRVAARFKKFYVGIGLTAVSISYAVVNWSKEKDATWFSKLGFDLTSVLISRWVGGKIVANPGDSFVKKYLKAYLFQAGIDSMSNTLYAEIFGVSEDIAEQRLKMITEGETFKEDIKQLYKYLEENEIDKIFVKQMEEYLIKEDDNLRAIKPDDLSDDEVKDIFISAITRQMYEEGSGDWIKTGNKGVDRYLFYRAYSAGAYVTDIGVGLLLYNTLCMGASNPTITMAKAAGIFFVYKAITEPIHYATRRKAINQ